ncbi:NAD-dependent succinate-semialdehyde dehydrogenase [Estrella lausannensis]|uniref:Succinate-semialdehyde dehydrogenase n=1 Tax=Estrella lausannensis TaxID=483423 RepID=A0A0H5DRK0_9BACT|nr:NAD-dependent succinate-semialdehyde dehydrogenase [Estrella lausannensis]CRX38833.1 succinate-semialdehyde dehydrogenase [Estrella lausannensis]
MPLDSMLQDKKITSLIGGKLQESTPLPFKDITTDEKWLELHPVDKNGVLEAIELSMKAFQTWREEPAPSRGAALRRVASLLLANKDLFAEVMAREMGKPVSEGAGEVAYAASFFTWFAGEAERLYGLEIPSSRKGKLLLARLEPVGPTAVITPWNFPIAMAARKCAAALAAGCTVIAKPSLESPMSLLLLAKACHEAGIPPSVFQVLVGDEKMIGQELLASPNIRKLSFTGSAEVGKLLYNLSSNTLKKVTLELGGNAPFIVLDDADLDLAAKEAIPAKFRNAGQTCIAANRFLIHEKIFDEFSGKLIHEIEKLTFGSPLNPETNVSCHLHPLSLKRMEEHLQDALEQGASLLLGGKPGEPTVISGVTPGMRIFHEETFGPIAALMKVKSADEALLLANDCRFGLAAYLFTDSLASAHHFSNHLEFGIIAINDGLPSAAEASFGGMKDSGIGREGGPSGILEYLTEKFLSIRHSKP